MSLPPDPACFDVAIIGYGPVGATLANQLGQAGWRVAVIERETTIYPLPRAIHFDGEVMRIFQNIGLADEVQTVTRPGMKGMHFVNADDRVLLVRGGTAALGPHGCASNHYFHQPELEAVLRRGVARFPGVAVFEGHNVVAIGEAGEGPVTLTVESREGAPSRSLQARYVVGCDGARSIVRRALGATMEDLGLHQPWLVFDALLRREAALPDHTVQHCDPRRPMTSCMVTGRRRRWEIMLMPGDDPQTIARPESVWPMLARWISPEDAELERSVVYTFHSVIAHGWRRGRLMIAGDAAHQTPPFLGQGMCAGIRDAANLAWKLDAILRGRARDGLLDSYESERKPHARAFIELAVRLGDVIQATDPAVVERRDREFLQGEARVFEFPAPGLGPGIHSGLGPAGSIFPQPRMADGRLLDERVGQRFALFGTPATLASARLAPCWQRDDVTLLDEAELGPAMRQWLAAHEAAAVLLRPDRYVADAARGPSEFERLSRFLPGGPSRR
ncbi:MAG TPA: bifunctional 3-(3-hydroxy-phenyl)propionate/3-hydroxycinnamic acid hydroxylase [Burkholderiaceae bacterium]|nr:bifunctional 3-(3-hydroxy-phenyl)propionate/3-hydroxycinnamic acid hydroxylase [Burkholderiaceae bacterium]